ncbi:MAG TPA: phosphotransferase [Novosphingobium sp.]
MADHTIGALPVDARDITPDLLNAALAPAFPGIKLKSIRIDDAHHGFSTVLRVHLEEDSLSKASGVPRSIMYKSQFEASTWSKAREYTYKSLEMEFHGYTFLPELGVAMPKIFFKQLDPERSQMVMLMEDLGLRAVRFQRGLSPNTPEQVKRRLTAMAQYHAKTWGSPEHQPGGRYHVLPSNGASMFVDFMDHAETEKDWPHFISLPRSAACPVKFHDFDWLKRLLIYAGDLSDEQPFCVVHGDTHLGNLYEEEDGTPGFFDTLARRESGLLEASYHIVNAMDPIDRRKYDRDLIRHYRDVLIANGANPPSMASMMHQFAAYISVNYVTFVVNQPTYQSEAFNTVHAMRAAQAMMDHDSFDIV